MNIYLILAIGYLVGNFNPAHFIAKIKGINIREVGSKNPGASNITMKLGWKYGILTGVLDILKAFVPVLTLKLLSYDTVDLVMMGTAVIIGHIYPVFHKFKGGKGTASFVGFTLALNPLYGVILGLIIVFGTIITDYIAIGTMLMMAAFIIGNFFIYDTEIFIIGLIVPFISTYKHIPNILRILKKDEQGLRKTFKK